MKNQNILFWGFYNISIISALVKKLKKDSSLKEYFIQIEKDEKTVNLIELFPSEMLRYDGCDLNSMVQWIDKNKQNNIVVLIDLISILLNNKLEKFYDGLEKLLKLENKIKYIFIIPNDKLIIKNQSAIKNIKYINSIYNYYSNSLIKIKSLIINSSIDYNLYFVSCIEYHFIHILNNKIDLNKKFLFLKPIPNFICRYNFMYLSDEAFISRFGIEIQNIIDKNNIISAVSIIDPDTLNPFYNFRSKMNLMKVSLYSYYNKKIDNNSLKKLLYLMLIGNPYIKRSNPKSSKILEKFFFDFIQ